jgi:Protein of unknown function (DUF1214)
MKRALHPRAIPIEPSFDVVTCRALDRSFVAGCDFLGSDGDQPNRINSARRAEGMRFEDNGDLHIAFGPTAPAENERNWIQTVPDKGWFPILRIYGPLEAWFDKTWKPGEIQPTD